MDDLKKLINFLFNKISFIILVSVLSINAISETFQLGDLAPRGAPDGQLNSADALILQRLILGDITPTIDEMLIGDVAPLGAPDGSLNVGDLAVQQRAVLGLINLGTIDTGLPAPTLDTGTTPTTQNPYMVSGSTRPNVTVDIYVNGAAQQQVASDASGLFISDVYLFDGDNQIQATVSDISGTSELSAPVIVEYTNTIGRNQGGTISTDTVWTSAGPAGANDPYLITGTLSVDSNATLTIQPGVRLLFDAASSLTVNGRLLIQGTAIEPVILTSNTGSPPAAGDWTGIVINNSSVDSILEYAEIGYAIDGVVATGTDVTVRNCLIHDMTDNGIEMVDSPTGEISNCEIHTTVDHGIVMTRSSPLITGNYIHQTEAAVYAYDTSSPQVVNGNVLINNEYGVYARGYSSSSSGAGRNSLPVVTDNAIYDNASSNYYTTSFNAPTSVRLGATQNWWGTMVVDEISDTIFDNTDTPGSRPTVDFSYYLDSLGGTPQTGDFKLGAYTVNTVWEAGQYTMIGSVYVPPGVTLNIKAGALIEVAGDFVLEVDGTLLIEGNEAAPVVFTSTNVPAGEYGDWKGIEINSSSTSSNISYAVIDRAFYGVNVNGATVVISNSEITNYGLRGIYLHNNAFATITNNIIDGGDQSPIGIYIDGSSSTIDSNFITRNDHGVFMLGVSSALIQNNTITGNNIGINIGGNYSSDANSPDATVDSNNFYENLTAAIKYSGFDQRVLDATGNYWATVTLSEITAMIIGDSSLLVDTSSYLTTSANGPVMLGLVVTDPYFSPNTSSSKSNTTVTATLSEVSDWSVSISSTAGVVKTYPQVNGSLLSVDWDGTDNNGQLVGEGRYKIAITASNGISSPMVRNFYSTIDITPPVADIDNALSGVTLTNLLITPINGSAADQNFFNYQIEYGEGVSPTVWTVIDDVKTIPINNGKLIDWAVNSTDGSVVLNNGLHTLKLTSIDLAGNVASDSVQVTIDNLYLSDVSFTPKTFRPAEGDIANVTFTLHQPNTNLSLRISAESDHVLVREITQSYSSAGTYSLNWDGKDSSGNYVEDEAYVIELFAEAGGLVTNYSYNFTGVLVYNTSIIIDEGYNPYTNDHWKGSYSFWNDGRPARIKFDVRAPSLGGSQHWLLDNVPFYDTTIPIMFDGRDATGAIVPDSSYFFMDLPIDLPPNTIIVKGSKPIITGLLPAPEIEVKSNPYYMTFSYDQFTQIGYHINQDCLVTIKLLPPGVYNPADPNAILLISNESLNAKDANGDPEMHYFEWRGYDNAIATPDTNNIDVSEEGSYTFTIEAVSQVTGFSALYRGSLTLYH